MSEPTYTTAEILDLLRDCRDLAVIEAIHYVLNEEGPLYAIEDVELMSDVVVELCNKIRLGL